MNNLKNVIDNLPIERELKRELRKLADFSQYSSKEYFDSIREEGGKDPRPHFGRGERTLLKITYAQLCDLFGVSQRTIHRWITSGKLRMTLKDIVELYISRAQHDLKEEESV